MPRVAILSFHSHGDRSFLDDRELSLLSGDLRLDGVDNDLVVVAFGGRDGADAEAEQTLVATLAAYDVIVFERVWSRALIASLRASLPGKPFVYCRGEHELTDPPADHVCPGDPRATLLPLLRQIASLGPSLSPRAPRRFAPNLRPVVINPAAFTTARTFSVEGNAGCPYQADARDNPLYAGVEMPGGLGRGCAFCVTGNSYASRPPSETAASVLGQLRYVRAEAPEITRIVLKDQNPFAYLTEVVQRLAHEGVGGFTLMLETRADWMTRSGKRFDDALSAAAAAGIKISPFLVGIESFSQAELDRYNKGTTAEANIAFVERVWALKERHGDVFDLDSASFGFVLFSPWTTMRDLEINHEAIVRTRLDRLRGRLLLSRARLYPDTALYYLARRDGLLVDEHRQGEDSARRYGYYPAHPWRFAHDDVACFARVATEVVEATSGRDEMVTFRVLLEAFRAASRPGEVTAAQIVEALGAKAPRDLRARLARLVRPLSLDGPIGEGFRVSELAAVPRALRLSLTRQGGERVEVELSARGALQGHARSRHYDIRVLSGPMSERQRGAVDVLCRAIEANDR